jgi:phage-related protein
MLGVRFYATANGREPARDWLRSIENEDRWRIGEDLRAVQLGWPLGMPLVRKLGTDLWEVRSTIRDGIARVLFTVADEQLVVLHGFVKKSQRTPADDLALATSRMKEVRRETKEPAHRKQPR